MTLVELVERERATLRRAYLSAGAAAGLAAAAATVALGAALLGASRWLTLPRALPFVVWGVVVAAVLAARWYTRRALDRHATRTSVAERIEAEQGMRAGSVRGVIEVGDGSALGRFAAEALAARLGQASSAAAALAPGARRQASARRRLAGVGAAAALGLLALVAGTAGDGLAAVLRPVDAWRGTLLEPLAFAGAPRSALRGDSVSVRVRAPGRETVRVAWRAVGAAWRTSLVRVDPRTGVATASLGAVDAALRLVATDGRAATDTLAIDVTDRPFVGDLALRAEYPAYLGRSAEPVAAGESLRLPRGTRLVISGRASVALDALELVPERQAPLPLSRTGYQFRGVLPVEASGSWRFRAAARTVARVDVPAPLQLEMIADSAPQVDLRAPATDTTIVPGETVRLTAAATDDHGLAAVHVRSWRERAGGARAEAAVATVAAPPGGVWEGDIAFATPGALEPGDRLHVVVAAVDRSPWRQAGESRELVLRVPSLGEQRSGARRLADSAVAAATAAAASQKQLEQRSGELARSRADRSASSGEAGGAGSSRGEKAPSYENGERARALAQQQRALAARVDSVREQARRVERQLKQAGALDSALGARLQEAQKLLAEALTPELAAKLKAMEDAAAGQSGDQARRAMQDLAQEQQRTRQQLEQGVEMLKRAALEGAMQTLSADARDVAAQERKLADAAATGRATPPAEARELSSRSRELAKDVQDVRKRLEREGAKAGPERMQSAADNANRSAGEMSRAAGAEPPRDGAPPAGADTRGAAERAAAAMEEAARDLAQARDAQVGQWKQELTRDLDQSIQETLQLAREESALAEQSRAPASPAPGGQPPADAASGGEPNAGEPTAGDQPGPQQPGGQEPNGATPAGGERGGAQPGARSPGAAPQSPGSAPGESGAPPAPMAPGELRSRQSTLQQGTNRAAERLEQAGRKSALVSPRAQRAMADARRKVEAATRETASGEGGQQAAAAMQEAAAALNQAAAAMVRDRQRANAASSASGLPELLQRMQEAAKQQGQVNQGAAGLPLGQPGGQGEGGPSMSALARQQRRVAQSLEEVGDADASGRTDALAKEARDLAQTLERGAADASTLARQQRLHRRLLDAGRSMEQEEREDNGKREAQTAAGNALFTPEATTAAGRAGARYQPPSWNDLRGLSADERRVVLEYFKRLNAAP